VNVQEDRYRTVLRMLPVSYRAGREDEMVAAFLNRTWTGDPDDDEFLADYGRPTLSDVVAVAALAARVRLESPTAAARIAAGGRAAQVAAMVGLLVNAAASAAAVVQHWWITTGMPMPAVNQAALLAHPPDTATGIDVFGVLWIAACLAMLSGQYRAAKLLAVVALLPAIARTIQITTTHTEMPASFIVANWCDLLIYLLMAAATMTFHPRVPAPARRPWLIALVVVVCVIGPLVGVLPILQPVDRTWMDWPGLLCLAWLVAALIPPVTRTLVSATAAALLAMPVLALRLNWLVYAATQDRVADSPLPLIVGLVELTAVLAVGVPLVVHIGHRWQSRTAAGSSSASRS
jgi:hypothetical protein